MSVDGWRSLSHLVPSLWEFCFFAFVGLMIIGYGDGHGELVLMVAVTVLCETGVLFKGFSMGYFCWTFAWCGLCL